MKISKLKILGVAMVIIALSVPFIASTIQHGFIVTLVSFLAAVLFWALILCAIESWLSCDFNDSP